MYRVSLYKTSNVILQSQFFSNAIGELLHIREIFAYNVWVLFTEIWLEVVLVCVVAVTTLENAVRITVTYNIT